MCRHADMLTVTCYGHNCHAQKSFPSLRGHAGMRKPLITACYGHKHATNTNVVLRTLPQFGGSEIRLSVVWIALCSAAQYKKSHAHGHPQFIKICLCRASNNAEGNQNAQHDSECICCSAAQRSKQALFI
eukprot:1140734-Pelagomonas_calceolata.AAC.10